MAKGELSVKKKTQARTCFVAAVVFGFAFAAWLVLARNPFQAHGESRQDSPVQCRELLTAPDFDDVSALNGDDVARIDDWLQKQM